MADLSLYWTILFSLSLSITIFYSKLQKLAECYVAVELFDLIVLLIVLEAFQLNDQYLWQLAQSRPVLALVTLKKR
jgi:hypothetical protein